MTKNRSPADNPTTALFDLAEQMASNYHKIIYIKYYAYIFIGITLILLIILSILLINQNNIAVVIIFLALILSGMMLLRLVVFTKNFLDDFDTNFRAISMVRDIDPLPKIPKGRTQVERLEVYLKNQDPVVTHEIKSGVEVVKNYKISNKLWSLAILHRPRRFGGPGFLILAQVIKGEPKMKDVLKFEKDLELVAKEFMLPERAIMLCKAPINFDGISNDLYSYLTEKEHYILNNGKKQNIKLQLFVEHGGRYEIIPLIP